MQIPVPYVVFLGDVNHPAYAKTAFGVAQWCPERCLGQIRFPGCLVDTGLPDMTVADAAKAGAKTLLVGVAPVGGAIQVNWLELFIEAANAGLHIVAGLHTKLNDSAPLMAAAERNGVTLIDVRTPPANIPVANGKKRTGRRLLTVGTDCAVGKKYAALAIARALKTRGVDCTFRATGQTGIMIAGEGIPIDAVVSDFVAGAAESLSPENDPDHWDIIEGQGSLFNPVYAGVSLGLLHGSQPDAIVLCHDPLREHVIGCTNYLLPDINVCINTHLALGSLTNAEIQCVGMCVNTSGMAAGKRDAYLQALSARTSKPCIDPLVEGVDSILDRLFAND